MTPFIHFSLLEKAEEQIDFMNKFHVGIFFGPLPQKKFEFLAGVKENHFLTFPACF